MPPPTAAPRAPVTVQPPSTASPPRIFKRPTAPSAPASVPASASASATSPASVNAPRTGSDLAVHALSIAIFVPLLAHILSHGMVGTLVAALAWAFGLVATYGPEPCANWSAVVTESLASIAAATSPASPAGSQAVPDGEGISVQAAIANVLSAVLSIVIPALIFAPPYVVRAAAAMQRVFAVMSKVGPAAALFLLMLATNALYQSLVSFPALVPLPLTALLTPESRLSLVLAVLAIHASDCAVASRTDAASTAESLARVTAAELAAQAKLGQLTLLAMEAADAARLGLDVTASFTPGDPSPTATAAYLKARAIAVSAGSIANDISRILAAPRGDAPGLRNLLREIGQRSMTRAATMGSLLPPGSNFSTPPSLTAIDNAVLQAIHTRPAPNTSDSACRFCGHTSTRSQQGKAAPDCTLPPLWPTQHPRAAPAPSASPSTPPPLPGDGLDRLSRSTPSALPPRSDATQSQRSTPAPEIFPNPSTLLAPPCCVGSGAALSTAAQFTSLLLMGAALYAHTECVARGEALIAATGGGSAVDHPLRRQNAVMLRLVLGAIFLKLGAFVWRLMNTASRCLLAERQFSEASTAAREHLRRYGTGYALPGAKILPNQDDPRAFRLVPSIRKFRLLASISFGYLLSFLIALYCALAALASTDALGRDSAAKFAYVQHPAAAMDTTLSPAPSDTLPFDAQDAGLRALLLTAVMGCIASLAVELIAAQAEANLTLPSRPSHSNDLFSGLRVVATSIAVGVQTGDSYLQHRASTSSTGDTSRLPPARLHTERHGVTPAPLHQSNRAMIAGYPRHFLRWYAMITRTHPDVPWFLFTLPTWTLGYVAACGLTAMAYAVTDRGARQAAHLITTPARYSRDEMVGALTSVRVPAWLFIAAAAIVLATSVGLEVTARSMWPCGRCVDDARRRWPDLPGFGTWLANLGQMLRPRQHTRSKRSPHHRPSSDPLPASPSVPPLPQQMPIQTAWHTTTTTTTTTITLTLRLEIMHGQLYCIPGRPTVAFLVVA
ncbi:hypothetical protein BC828DRAFT_439384 [Blastocladiella britannica]|nr:hypothetical protein BC828DRAFT_439384 [Blastocladiella britannica]